MSTKLYDMNYVLSQPFLDERTVQFCGLPVRLPRYWKLFQSKGMRCVSCGIEANHFYVTKTNGLRVFRLCHKLSNPVRRKRTFISFTIDHIVPVSKGGTFDWDNLAPMCQFCNGKKGNSIADD